VMHGLIPALLSSLVMASYSGQTKLQGSSEPDQHLSYWMKTSRQHPHPLIRKNAVRVLSTLKQRKAVPILIEALQDENYRVRYEAAQGLGRQGDERAFGALRELIERESDPSVRRAAQRSIELINAHLAYQKKIEKSGRSGERR